MELEARVEQISATVQELRQNAGDGRTTRQLLDSLFRTVHSLKAAASAEGLTGISRTAHEFENLLHALRTGKLTLDAEVLQAFEATTAALLDGAKTSVAHDLKKLTHIEATHEAVSDQKLRDLKDDERHRAAEAMREGSNLYVMEAVFEIVDFDQRFRQLKAQLERMAEVISTSAAMDEDKIKFQILYAAKSEKIRVHAIFERAVLAGKSTGSKLGKEVNFEIETGELLLDSSSSDPLDDVLLHLVRNAVDHGIELRGKVTLSTQISSGSVRLFVSDDGRGIDPANLPLLFQPGFSTAKELSEVSGRGVGLDVVKTQIEALGGSINVVSKLGKGTSFVITMPDPSSDA